MLYLLLRLMRRALPFKFLLYVILGELASLRPQHIGNLHLCHPDLIADGYQAARKMHVVLPQKGDGLKAGMESQHRLM